MDLGDFKIGERFYTATGSWICVDIGTKTILAAKELPAYAKLKADWGIATPNPKAIVAKYDMLDLEIFYDYDFGGCCKTDRFD